MLKCPFDVRELMRHEMKRKQNETEWNRSRPSVLLPAACK